MPAGVVRRQVTHIAPGVGYGHRAPLTPASLRVRAAHRRAGPCRCRWGTCMNRSCEPTRLLTRSSRTRRAVSAQRSFRHRPGPGRLSRGKHRPGTRGVPGVPASARRHWRPRCSGTPQLCSGATATEETKPNASSYWVGWISPTTMPSRRASTGGMPWLWRSLDASEQVKATWGDPAPTGCAGELINLLLTALPDHSDEPSTDQQYAIENLHSALRHCPLSWTATHTLSPHIPAASTAHRRTFPAALWGSRDQGMAGSSSLMSGCATPQPLCSPIAVDCRCTG
ncbi:hypothetical protein JOF56_009504 [Kibdelosporangium banguiense]|uniref:Uncharacterized protein n=1 Tax=Kibdelosporangium banguiense TaxID=1365924 RepID=A0ABS4TXM1_9PSEU|nr:hypothetical protein [Kibdelosporangium banguiense]